MLSTAGFILEWGGKKVGGWQGTDRTDTRLYFSAVCVSLCHILSVLHARSERHCPCHLVTAFTHSFGHFIFKPFNWVQELYWSHRNMPFPLSVHCYIPIQPPLWFISIRPKRLSLKQVITLQTPLTWNHLSVPVFKPLISLRVFG